MFDMTSSELCSAEQGTKNQTVTKNREEYSSTIVITCKWLGDHTWCSFLKYKNRFAWAEVSWHANADL